MKYLSLFILSVLIVSACKEKTVEETEVVTTETTEEVVAEPTILNGENGYYGEEFDVDGAISYEDALASLADSDSLIVKITGSVNEVCQVKGCWMTMGNDETSMRVKFKDYGFFVPKDCSGKSAVLNGIMKKEIVSIDEQKHYLEDAGAEQAEIDAITEDKENLSFIASGVRLQ